MLVLNTRVEIGDTKVFLNELDVVSSWQNFTDTARVKFPRRLAVRVNGKLTNAELTAGDNPLWERGSPIKIYAGYGDNMTLRFDGYVTRINNNFPAEVEAEDKMWLLKQGSVNKSFLSGTTLKTVLSGIIPADIQFDCEDVKLSKHIFEKITPCQALNEIKQKYGLMSYFVDGVLYVGFAYRIKTLPEITADNLKEFHLSGPQGNIIDDSNLDYVRQEDVKLRINAVNIYKNNKRKEITVGDPDGELRTMIFYDMDDKDVKRLATEMLELYKYEGFRGSFLAFLDPKVTHGMAIKLVDRRSAGLGVSGVYLVKQVTTSVSVSGGGRQEIFLDRKIS